MAAFDTVLKSKLLKLYIAEILRFKGHSLLTQYL